MGVKLVERYKVKDALGIARADTINDDLIAGMIEQASDEAEQHCRRKFSKAVRTEYKRSYEQNWNEPDPQYLWLEGPIDSTLDITLVWAPYMMHATTQALTLVKDTDFFVDYGQSLLRVILASLNFQTVLPMSYLRGAIMAADNGFKVSYTGGYEVSAAPEGNIDDPLDDFGVVAVPIGLKSILTRKIAADYTAKKMLQAWTDAELSSLKPHEKKDRI